MWCHLLHGNVANQSLHPEEDAKNKAWRPVPAGLILRPTARFLRWILLLVCLAVSILCKVPEAGVSLTVVNLCYHELGFDSHWAMKNVCNALGSASFMAGAARVMCGEQSSPRIIVMGRANPSYQAHLSS